MQGRGLKDQAYLRLKEFRPDLFFGVTPEMEGPNFYSSDENDDDNDDDKNSQGGSEDDVNGEEKAVEKDKDK